MSKVQLYISLFGYAVLLYLFILMPIHLYTPVSRFDLPNLLWFMHLILLYIHEAGHLIFSIFGKTISILGGSLNQVLIPLVWYVVAWREHSSMKNVALFTTGASIVDVSIYVKDAEVLKLPLIGGLSKAHHDWRNLLRGWDALDQAFFLGEVLFWIGMFCAATGIILGVLRIVNEFRNAASAPQSTY